MDTQRFQRAIALRDSGRVADALEELRSMVDSTVDPEEKASLIMNQAECYRALGRIEDARKYLHGARRVAPRTEPLLYLNFQDGVLSWCEGKRDRGLEKLDRLLQDYRELLDNADHRDLYKDVQINRGIFLTALGRFREARGGLEECLSLDLSGSDQGDVLCNLGVCYANLGENSRAKEKLLEALRSPAQAANITSAHYYLGTIFFTEGAYAKALQEFERCLPHAGEAHIPKAHLYAWLATTARSLGLTEEAEQYEKLAKG